MNDLGLLYDQGLYKPQSYVHINDGPAGAWDATAVDMAHFMSTHLQLGQFQEKRILQTATARKMQQEQFTHDPRLLGVGFGFFLLNTQGRLLVKHDGGHLGFYSSMILIPEEHLGIFFSCNQYNVMELDVPKVPMDLVNALLDRYVPTEKRALAEPPPDFPHRAGQFTGSYRNIHYDRGGLFKLATSLLQQVEIGSEDGMLLFRYLGLAEPTRWVEVDSLYFLEANGLTAGDRHMAFRRNENGRITHMFHVGGEAYEKIPWYEAVKFQLIFMGLFVLIFSSTYLVWPVSYLIRRLRGISVAQSQMAQTARWLAGLTCGLNLIFLVGLVFILVYRLFEFTVAVPSEMIALLVIPLFTSALSIGMAVFTAMAWKYEYWSIGGRLYYSVVACTTFGFIWFLYYWNLLGFHL